MDWNAYQTNAAKTSGAKDDTNPNGRVIVAVLGLAGEAGELANKLKKEIGHKHPTPLAVYEDELGDVLWYLAELCTALEVKFDDLRSVISPDANDYFTGTDERLLSVAALLKRSGHLAAYLIELAMMNMLGVDTAMVALLMDVLAALYETMVAFDLTVEQVADTNLAKLAKRYPAGFSPEASLNRTA